MTLTTESLFANTVTNYKQLCINKHQCLELAISGSISGNYILS